MKIRLLTVLLTVCFILSLAGTVSAAGTDISGYWAQAQIEKWISSGLAAGYPDGNFKPDNDISRAEFVSFVNRAFKKQNNSAQCEFSDVKPSDWFYREVASGKAAGYISGYPDGTFRPDDLISRQEAAIIIEKLLNLSAASQEEIKTFADANSFPAWSRDGINKVAAKKIMSGYPDGTFKPDNPITRAEAVVALDRALAAVITPTAFEGIKGTVTINGQPVEGALTRLFNKDGHEVLQEATTGKDGKYELVAQSGAYDITVSKEENVGYASDVNVPKNNVVIQDLSLVKGIKVTGKLLDNSGQPLANAKIFLTTNPTFVQETDANGQFTFFVPKSGNNGEKFTYSGYIVSENNSMQQFLVGTYFDRDTNLGTITVGASGSGGGGGGGASTGDTTPPALSTATVNGATLQLTYNEPLDSTSVPGSDSFTISVNGAAQTAPANVTIVDHTVSLTLATAVKAGDTVTVSYTPGTSPIRDKAGNNAAAFSNQSVTNNTQTQDTTPPVLNTAVVNGATLQLTYNEPLDSTSVPGGDAFTVNVNGAAQTAPANVTIVDHTVSLTLATAVKAGDTVTVSYTPGTSPIRDEVGNNAATFNNQSVTNNTGALVGPAIDPTVASSVYTSTAFLYTGNNPVQTGMALNIIEEKRAAVLRGKVMVRDGTPLSGVKITVSGHPEFGQTLTREDGFFDMAVNGGGLLTVDYSKDGYLPVQRQINTPWADFALLPDVVMITYDSQVTTITLGENFPAQVARGSQVTDKAGSRQATLIFPQGTTAEMVFADGRTQALTSMNVRATEYTVGDNGPATMPAELPPSVGYTYCVEYSVDQAVAAGAKEVRFSQPVIQYVENFLDFPVGGIVPVGYYDSDKKAWISSDNGKVVKIIGIDNGLAVLDIDGSGAAATTEALTALGVTDDERQRLAKLYSPGQSLWRVPITHFTPWDCNWPYGPPDDAQPPEEPEPDAEYEDETCSLDGSIIEAQNQILGESSGIHGTPFSLNYRSYRVPGYKSGLNIPLSGAKLPSSVSRIDLEVLVAGKRFAKSFPAKPNQSYVFNWDGKDVYGRLLQGEQPVTVRIGYAYNVVYYQSPEALYRSWARLSGIPLSVNGRQEVILWQEWNVTMKPLGRDFNVVSQGLGAWTLDVCHAFDPNRNILYTGDGHRHSVKNTIANVITTVAGTGIGGYGGDGGPAVAAQIKSPAGVAAGPDGCLYVADSGNHCVRRVGPDGIITTVAGTGQVGYSGDSGPAVEAKLGNPEAVAMGPDGSIYITDSMYGCIRRVSPNGIITRVAGAVIELSFATVKDASLTLNYNWPLDTTSIPAGSAFAVKVNGTIQAPPANVAVANNTVTLTLASAVKVGDIITVSYTPGTNPIRDTGGNNAPALTDQAVTNYTTLPFISMAAVNGATLHLTYNKLLDTTSVPAGNDFTVFVNSTAQTSPTNVTVTDNTVTLTLASAVKAGDVVKVSYKPGINSVRDTAGDNAVAFDNLPVTNNTTRPVLTKETVNGTIMRLTYDKPLDTTSVPAGNDFTVFVNFTAQTSPTNVTVADNTVTLTLASAVNTGAFVTISYKPGANPIRDTAGNNAIAFNNLSVANNTITLNWAYINAPATLTLNYNKVLDTSSVPAGSDFTVFVNGTAQASPTKVTVANYTVTLTLASVVKPGVAVTISYTPGANSIRDTAGDDAAAFVDQSVTNELISFAFDWAHVYGTALSLNYNQPLDSTSIPAVGDFIVKVNGTAQAPPTDVTVAEYSVILTLASAVQWNDEVTISYTPGANPIRDTAGDVAPALTDQLVNSSPPVYKLPAVKVASLQLKSNESIHAGAVLAEESFPVEAGGNGIFAAKTNSDQGGSNSNGGAATAAELKWPAGIAVGADGSIYVVDRDNNCIRRVGPDGVITTLVGKDWAGYSGDGGPAVTAQLCYPQGVAVGPDGSIYIADSANNRIRRIGTDGIITTVAGTGQAGYSGDGGPAVTAQLYYPQGVAVGTDGSLYIADKYNYRIRRVGPDGVITTLAGKDRAGYSGDGGPAGATQLYYPQGVAVGPDGSIYIADIADNRIRRVGTPALWTVTNEIRIPSKDGSEIYVFDGRGHHLRTIDALTGSLKYQFFYNAAGLLTSVQDGDGNITVIERDASGAPTAIVAPGGQRTGLHVDANGYLDSITCPLGHVTGLEYDSGGLLTKLTDNNGNEHRFSYTDMGRLIKDENPAGGFTALADKRLDNGWQVTATTAMDRTTTYEVHPLPGGGTRSANTWPTGVQTVATDENNGGTTVSYPDGTVVNEVNGPDPRWGMQIPLTQKSIVTTPGGITSTVEQTGTVTLRNPNDPLSIDKLAYTTNVNGNSFSGGYDTATKQITITTAAGRQVVYTLDDRGRTVQEEVYGLDPLNYTYDARGLLTKVRQGDRFISYTYDDKKRVSAITDTTGKQIRYTYNDANLLTSMTLPGGETYQFGYDKNGNRTQVIMPSGAVHKLDYTVTGLDAGYTPPNGPGYMNNYDLDQALKSINLPGGRFIDASYDAGGRPTGFSYNEAEVTITYPDATSRVGSITRTPADGGTAQTLSYTYDGSLVTGVTVSGQVYGQYKYRYDNNFDLVGITLDNGPETVITRDADGLVKGYGPFTFTRNGPAGAPSQINDSMLSNTLEYDSGGRLKSRTCTVNGQQIYRMQLAYDNSGLISQKIETVVGSVYSQDYVYSYTYDANGQLTGVSLNGALVESYTYDENGNRTSKKIGVNTSEAASYDVQDRLVKQDKVNYQFDDDGFLTSRGNDAFQYSANGELLKATLNNGDQITYLYDGLGRQVGRTVTGATYDSVISATLQTCQYLYGNPGNTYQVTATRDSAGTISKYYYDGAGLLLAIERGNVRYYVATDQVGTPRVITDDTGQIIKILDYDSFGNLISDSNPAFYLPIGFAGGLSDPKTGLIRFGLRDYEPATGRWTARDPILFDGGHNLYVYVGNDPIGLRDPSGRVIPLVIVGGVALGEVLADAALVTATVAATGYLAYEVDRFFSNDTDESEKSPQIPDMPTTPPDQPPGEDYEWRGRPGCEPGGKEGNWHNPKTGESLRPHLDDPTHEPHWDYREPDNGPWWRLFPNGGKEMK